MDAVFELVFRVYRIWFDFLTEELLSLEILTCLFAWCVNMFAILIREVVILFGDSMRGRKIGWRQWRLVVANGGNATLNIKQSSLRIKKKNWNEITNHLPSIRPIFLLHGLMFYVLNNRRGRGKKCIVDINRLTASCTFFWTQSYVHTSTRTYFMLFKKV